MATTKRAQHRFVLKEGGEQAREIRERVVGITVDYLPLVDAPGRELRANALMDDAALALTIA